MLKLVWVPCIKIGLPKLLMKILSLSETIDLGKPWSFTMLLKNSLRTKLAVKGCVRGMKWMYLVKWSTTTIIVSLPFDLGTALMKSTLMSSQAWLGISKGRSKRDRLLLSPLFLVENWLKFFYRWHEFLNGTNILHYATRAKFYPLSYYQYQYIFFFEILTVDFSW